MNDSVPEVAFYLNDWKTLQGGIDATRKWASTKRKIIDKCLGVEERVDEDHPEVIARKKMTAEEERDYLVKRYWAPKDRDT